MPLKDDWVAGNSFTHADQNSVADQVNANTLAIVGNSSQVDAYISFASKPDGDPPAVLDTGEAVDYVWGASSFKPQISDDKLVHGTLPGSGSYADYYQAQTSGDCRAFGARWTVDSGDGSTNAYAVIAAWSDIYQTEGTLVPRHAAHVTFSTTTQSWGWYVSDGISNDNFIAVKSGTFTAPASDGSTVWDAAVYLDPDNGKGYCRLPGVDSSTGTRYVTVTDAEIAAAQTSAGVTVRTLAYLAAGTSVPIVEHYASANANTAIYPQFLDMWAELLHPARDLNRQIHLESAKPAATVYTRYVPSTTATFTPSASMTQVDSGHAFVEVVAGPTGRILFGVDCYLEFTGDDVVMMRMRESVSAATTVEETVIVGVSGQKAKIHFTAEKTGLTPGAYGIWFLQFACQNSAVTMKVGGDGSFATKPGLYIQATPL